MTTDLIRYGVLQMSSAALRSLFCSWILVLSTSSILRMVILSTSGWLRPKSSDQYDIKRNIIYSNCWKKGRESIILDTNDTLDTSRTDGLLVFCRE
jgi:hypothetical protein